MDLKYYEKRRVDWFMCFRSEVATYLERKIKRAILLSYAWLGKWDKVDFGESCCCYDVI